jgi:hypothetical protein
MIDGMVRIVIELKVTVQPLRRKDTKKNYQFKPLSKRKESIAKKVIDAVCTVNKRKTLISRHRKLTGKRLGFLINFNVFFIKTVLKELYYNLCVFVTLWLNYYN